MQRKPAIKEWLKTDPAMIPVLIFFKGLNMNLGAYVKSDDQGNVSFKIQNGTIGTVGVNGCRIDDIIIFVRQWIEGVNKDFPCRENSIVCTKLEEAELWLLRRKQNRKKCGEEGINQV